MIENKFLLLPALLMAVVSGCNSDSVSPDTSDTPLVLSDTEQCTIPAADFAEQLFTEADRQWFCSVATDGSGTVDEVYFRRNGQAEMDRFGQVFWNRSLPDQSINVASPVVSPFVISNIFSANTVLLFDLVGESGEVQVYDCVLVGRDVLTAELM